MTFLMENAFKSNETATDLAKNAIKSKSSLILHTAI